MPAIAIEESSLPVRKNFNEVFTFENLQGTIEEEGRDLHHDLSIRVVNQEHEIKTLRDELQEERANMHAVQIELADLKASVRALQIA